MTDQIPLVQASSSGGQGVQIQGGPQVKPWDQVPRMKDAAGGQGVSMQTQDVENRGTDRLRSPFPYY